MFMTIAIYIFISAFGIMMGKFWYDMSCGATRQSIAVAIIAATFLAVFLVMGLGIRL
jgi:hypothetical protein